MADFSLFLLKWYDLARRGYPRAALSLFEEFAVLVEAGDLSAPQRKVLGRALRNLAAGKDAGGAFSERPDVMPKLEGGLPLRQLTKGLDILQVFEALRECSSEHRAANVIRGARCPNMEERRELRLRTDKAARRKAFEVGKGAGAQTIKDCVRCAYAAIEEHREINRQEFTGN